MRPEELPRLPTGVCATRGATSSVTFGELIRGALRSGRLGLLLEQIEAVIPAMFAVLPFDGVAAQRYGEVRAGQEKEGYVHR